jgi:capsular exopolysaccharide synthesis family protein
VDLSHYLRGIGRRWKVILAAVLVALAVGWYLSPDETAPAPRSTVYEATTYLLSSAESADVRAGSNLQTVAALATLGEVPRRVAQEIDYEGDPSTLAASVTVEPDETTQLLSITATAETAPRAKLIADTFAEQLLALLSERTEVRVDALAQELERLDREIARLDALLPDARTEVGTRESPAPEVDPEEAEEQARLQQELSQLQFERQFAQTEYSQLASGTGGNLAGFDVVEEASAMPLDSGEGLQAPRARGVRLLIAAAIGLLLGLAIALLLERIDTRLRTKPATEEAYGLPVLAVIPTVGRKRRDTIVTETAPRGAAANSFRLLEAALQLGRQDSSVHVAGNGKGGGPRTILVTSGEPREGKSTVVANLAVAFAEVGKRVVVVCCDYRHPTLHATFGVEHEFGLTDALEAEAGTDLEPLIQDTAIERVRVLATGRVPSRPGMLFGSERVRQVLASLRSVADVVLIDTAPVLAASDWTQLLPQVDAVAVVARAGKTDAGSARRTAEVLLLLQAPVVGVVLNAVPRGLIRQATDRSWYRYQEPERRARAVESETPGEDGVTVDGTVTANENGGAAKQDEGIPHLARPGRED